MDITDIKEEFNNWEENTLNKFISKNPQRQDDFITASSHKVNALYTPLDISEENYAEDIGFPAEFPYTRGVYPNMYRGKFWTMRQYAGFGNAEQSNKRYKYLLENGQTGLSVAFDLPTQIGYDSDHPLSEGEVGKVGVAIDSLLDMEILFKDIPLDKVSTSMTINAPAAILLAMYAACAEKQNIPINQLHGTIQNDILKEYVARGTYIFPPKPSMRLVVDTFAFCSAKMPKWNTISISGYHIREAGSNAIQEIAFTLADGIEYCRAALKAGLDIDSFAPHLSFFFNSHNDLFEEVAKFRAARRLWAKIMKDKFKPKDPRSLMLRFHTQTAGSTLTAQQPDNNIIRVTLQALAAVLGGTQSLHTNSRDEALALPTEKSVQIALRTQQVIANESGAANTIDPLAGSYFVENLTNTIEKEALIYINKIEDMGGMTQAIEDGYVQNEIMASSYRYQKEIEDGKRIIVGINKYAQQEEPLKDILRVDHELRKTQTEKLIKIKAERDEEKVNIALSKIKIAAEKDDNLMPYIIEAVKEYATLGEICQILRTVFGEYQQHLFI